ncbi:MAG TPA: hypothetical protein VFM56_15995, partial [Solimonas sp.]|nr:hypothetical protein [Solimonas sp.]
MAGWIASSAFGLLAMTKFKFRSNGCVRTALTIGAHFHPSLAMSRWRPPSEKSSPYITAEGHA